MSFDSGKGPRAAAPESGVRYSERYLRQRERFTRRALLFGGIGCLLAGIAIVHDAIGAMQTGELVTLGLRVLPRVPAFLAALFGAFLALLGFGLLGALLLRRK